MWLREMQAPGHRQDASGRIEDPEPAHGSNTHFCEHQTTAKGPAQVGQQVAVGAPRPSRVCRLPRARDPRGRGPHLSSPGLSHFLPRRPPPSPGRTSSSAGSGPPPAGTRPLPPGPGGEFLRVPGGPRVGRKTGNCKSLGPSALPRGFPVTPAPRRPSRG